ncbi:hypothetical protein ACQY0O_002412 [Thecaphora frezii]
MAPSTRREARLSAILQQQQGGSPDSENAVLDGDDGGGSGNGSGNGRSTAHFFPNVENILDNFEAFKRKHIAQNREIIKTNALAQMRIRELETKIETLESEREAQALASIHLRAKVSRLEHAVSCVRTGWDVIARGLGALNADLATPTTGAFAGLELDMAIVGPEPQLRPGNRITLDPSALPAGVVRSIARAPDPNLVDLAEDEDEDEVGTQPVAAGGRIAPHPPKPSARMQPSPETWPLDRQDTPMLGSGREFGGAAQSDFHLIQQDPLFDVGGPPSPMSSPGLPIDLENAIAAATRDGSTPEWRPNPPHFVEEEEDDGVPTRTALETADVDIREALRAQHEAISQVASRSSRRTSRRQSGLLSPPLFLDADCGADGDPSERATINGCIRHGRDAGADGNIGDDHDSSMTSPPLPLDQRALAGPILTAGLMTSSTILRELTNGVKHAAQSKDDAVDSKDGLLLRPTPRKASRQKMEAALIAKKASLDDLGPREPSTPGGVKRKMSMHDADERGTPSVDGLPASPSPQSKGTSAASASAASASASTIASETDMAFGRARRTRKSVNYALPKLNTKMRKPDPVDLIPATPGRASASRHATPSSSSRRVGSTGNLQDLRKQRQAATSRSTDEQSADDDDDNDRRSARRSGPDDDDGNGDWGSASLADLFETNPPRPRTLRKRSPQQAADADSHEAGSMKKFWRTESNTDTSDDESRAMSISDLGDIEQLEESLGSTSTHADDDERRPAGSGTSTEASPPPSCASVTKSHSSSSIQSACSADGDGGTGQRPSLRRRSTTLPPRATGLASSASAPASVSPRLTPSNSSGSTVAGEQTPRADGEAQPSSLDRTDGGGGEASSLKSPASSADATPTQAVAAGSPEATDPPAAAAAADGVSEAATAAKTVPPRTITTRRLSAARLTASTRTSERPKSAGNGATRSASASAGLLSLSSTSSPNGASALSSLGRAGGATVAAALQRGSLHAALTNQPRSAGLTSSGGSTPQMSTKGLPPTNSPVLRSSPLLGGAKTLRPSASTSSLGTATSSGRSSPALSMASTNSSGSPAPAAAATATARTTSSSTTSALARTTTTKQATIVAAAAAATAPHPSARSAASRTAPHPSRSMPSLKRAAGVEAAARPSTRASAQGSRPGSSGGLGLATTGASAATPSQAPTVSTSALRITVRSTPSMSSMSSERSAASSNATVTPSNYNTAN